MHVPTRESFGGSFVSRDVADVFYFMFGAQDHDWHVKQYRQRQKDTARRANVRPVFRIIPNENDPLYRVLKKFGDV